MYDHAESLIAQVKGLVASYGDDVQQAIVVGAYDPLSDAFDLCAPFDAVARAWWAIPGGGFRTGRGMALSWIWRGLLEGRSPADLLGYIDKILAENAYTARIIRPFLGVATSDEHRLTATASIVPNASLRKEWPYTELFCDKFAHYSLPNDTAALIQKVTICPAFTEGDRESFYTKNNEFYQQLDQEAEIIKFAVGLTIEGPVDIAAKYAECDSEYIVSAAGSPSYKRPTLFLAGSAQIDPVAVSNLIDKLQAMKSPKALELSAARLLSSRLPVSVEDRIIDLGMAAEIALMHSADNSNDGKSEITNKIGTRGAWLLDSCLEQRISTFKLLGDLYAARSKVVHTGVAPSSCHSKLIEFDYLVRRILLALLNRGVFPDWRSLVLGGSV